MTFSPEEIAEEFTGLLAVDYGHDASIHLGDQWILTAPEDKTQDEWLRKLEDRRARRLAGLAKGKATQAARAKPKIKRKKVQVRVRNSRGRWVVQTRWEVAA